MNETDHDPETNATLKRRWIEREFGTLLRALDERVARSESLGPEEIGKLRDELLTIVARLEAVEVRAGDAERFENATAESLIVALRNAGVREPESLSNSLSPYIVKSIRAEIENSREAVADALYPVLGRMIRLSIAEALEDLTRKVENSLPFERWWAAIQSKMTGRPALSSFIEQSFQVREALLIDRASGTLLARRPEVTEEDGIDPELTSALVSALVSFSEDALARDNEAVRQIMLSGSRFYLRSSPGVVLAIRGEGVPPEGLAARLDTIFEQFLERLAQARADGDGPDPAMGLLEDLRQSGQRAAAVPPTPLYKRKPVLIALSLGVAALLFWGWSLINERHIARWQRMAETAALADPRLIGYPLEFDVEGSGKRMTVTGLAPDLASLSALRGRIDALGPVFDGTKLEIDWKVTTIRVERTRP